MMNEIQKRSEMIEGIFLVVIAIPIYIFCQNIDMIVGRILNLI